MPIVNTPSTDPTVGEFCVYVLHDGDQYSPSYIGVTTRGMARRFRDHCKAARAGNTYPFYGKTHSEETKRKISETKKRNPSDVNHRRWHTNRGLVNPDCVHCQETKE